MDDKQKRKTQKPVKHQNVLESLKDIGMGTAKTLTQDVIRPQDIMEQFMGKMPQPRKYSGEINPGEALEINDVFSGKREENIKLKGQLALERKLRQEEKVETEKKGNELKLQLHAIMQEVATLASTTQNLGKELETASIQAPVNPGIYHLVFFERLLDFIKSFRRKAEDASIWLNASNKRAQKKNYWAKYKKHGAKFLLSGEHYLTRSAG